MILDTYIRGYTAYLQLEKGLAATSQAAYLNDIRKFQEFADLHDLNLQAHEIHLQHLQDFLSYLNELNLSANSQARMISGLKSFFDYLMLEEVIEQNPSDLLSAPKISRKLPAVLSVEEIDALLSSIDLSSKEGHRNRAMLEVLYACGLRVSELVNLKLSNFHPEVELIKVTGKGNKERLVPLGESAILQIEFYLQDRQQMTNIQPEAEDILFLNRRGRRLTRNMVFLIVKKAAAAANIQKNVSPHTFRHSFATHLIEGGADLRVIQQLLGHESITTTEIYTHLDVQFLQETLRSFHPRK